MIFIVHGIHYNYLFIYLAGIKRNIQILALMLDINVSIVRHIMNRRSSNSPFTTGTGPEPSIYSRSLRICTVRGLVQGSPPGSIPLRLRLVSHIIRRNTSGY